MKRLTKELHSVVLTLLLFYVLLVIRNAWISDDGIITFRVVENLLAGYGLGFNPYVRVQAFTHPLWMFLLATVRFVGGFFLPDTSGMLFYVVFILSILLSTLTVYLLLTRVASPGVISFSLAVLFLSVSNGFLDFSTSGLENPLTHFLLVVFVILYLSDRSSLFGLSFVSSLIALNRIDGFLLVAFALAYAWWQSDQRKKDLGRILLGMTPLALWELFSLFYFGFLFPNTAYAKLNTGVPEGLLLLQGLDYILNAVNWDTVTIFGIFLAGVVLYLRPDRRQVFLFVGVLLYLVYIIRIGGDFFSSRFLSAPFLVSVMIIVNQQIVKKLQLLTLSAVILLGVFSIRSPLWSSNMVAYLPQYQISDRNAISDQRLEYFGNERKGQYNSLVENGFRENQWGSEFSGDQWQFTGYNEVYIAEALGKPSYKKGPNTYVIDYFALSDPLLARLPATEWEIGHFRRDLPDGYIETLQTGANQIVDPGLALYYDKLQIVIAGPLFDWNRIAEIWKINTGQYDYLLENYSQR